MARAIVRFSIDGEANNTTGGAVSRALQEAGFVRTGTRLWEADLELASITAALHQMTGILNTPPGSGWLDHLFVYVNETVENLPPEEEQEELMPEVEVTDSPFYD